MTRGAARELFSNSRLQRWCFDVELIFLATQLKIPVVEVPIDWTEIPGAKVHGHLKNKDTGSVRAGGSRRLLGLELICTTVAITCTHAEDLTWLCPESSRTM